MRGLEHLHAPRALHDHLDRRRSPRSSRLITASVPIVYRCSNAGSCDAGISLRHDEQRLVLAGEAASTAAIDRSRPTDSGISRSGYSTVFLIGSTGSVRVSSASSDGQSSRVSAERSTSRRDNRWPRRSRLDVARQFDDALELVVGDLHAHATAGTRRCECRAACRGPRLAWPLRVTSTSCGPHAGQLVLQQPTAGRAIRDTAAIFDKLGRRYRSLFGICASGTKPKTTVKLRCRRGR